MAHPLLRHDDGARIVDLERVAGPSAEYSYVQITEALQGITMSPCKPETTIDVICLPCLGQGKHKILRSTDLMECEFEQGPSQQSQQMHLQKSQVSGTMF